MNAFTADRDRTLYMGEATHSKTTANKPKQGELKMKTATQKIDEAIERDNETGYACLALSQMIQTCLDEWDLATKSC